MWWQPAIRTHGERRKAYVRVLKGVGPRPLEKGSVLRPGGKPKGVVPFHWHLVSAWLPRGGLGNHKRGRGSSCLLGLGLLAKPQVLLVLFWGSESSLGHIDFLEAARERRSLESYATPFAMHVIRNEG